MSREPVPGDQRAALARLAAQVDAVQADLAAQTRLAESLRADVAAHTRTLTDLANTLRTLTTASAAPPPEPPARAGVRRHRPGRRSPTRLWRSGG